MLSKMLYAVTVYLLDNSLTYGKHYGIKLIKENKKQILIPCGFASSFFTFSDTTEFCNECYDFYHLNDEGRMVCLGVVGEYKRTALAEGYSLVGKALILSNKDKK